MLWAMKADATLSRVPPRKRDPERPNPRVTVEVYPQDADLIQRARVRAVSDRITLRELILRALLRYLDADDGGR